MFGTTATRTPCSCRVFAIVVCLMGIGLQGGCGDREEISTYSVDKPAPSSPSVDATTRVAPSEARLLGAIIPQGEQTWFFKVTGPPDELEKHAATVRDFIESVRFSDGQSAEPTWDLPADWQRDPGSGMRYATLRFGSEQEPLELSVIPLRTRGQEQADYLLQNINLWRSQLGLAPITPEQLSEETEQLTLDGATATMVNYVGQLIPHGMTPGGGPGQMATQVPGHPPIGQPGQSAAPTQPPPLTATPSPLVYDKPDAWTETAASGMRKAAFSVTEGDQQAEITVIDLSASAGDLLDNVNRWRGQLGLEPVTQAELDETVEKVTIDQTPAAYVELMGPEGDELRKAIVGAVLSNTDRTWFFKLTGSADLVQREKGHFRSFVESVKFGSTNGEGNGN